MRKKIVAGNWKMNMTRETGLSLVDEIYQALGNNADSGVKVILAPPFPFLFEVRDWVHQENSIFISAQNCHHEANGAFTGEVSAECLASYDCNYCIVGHSERRLYFHEDDELINLKIQRLLHNNISPIFCCGESLDERENESHFEVVGAQIQSGLKGLKKNQLLKVVVAYEPVWAIGTGKTATPEQAQEMHAFIREKLAEVLGNEASQVSILYGGSVKPDNAKELFSQADIDGGLIGGASLDSSDFLAIIHSF